MKSPFSCFALRALSFAALLLPELALATTFHINRGHSLANDANPGTPELPWATIQRAADQMVAGDEAIVHAGTYTELGRGLPNTQVAAIKPQNSGTADAPIIYRAAAGENVVIDQSNAGAGFYIQQRSFIHIEGFEIRNVRVAGIWTTVDGQQGISIQNNHIHGVRGGGPNDPGDADNVGAIKLDGCSECEVRGNVLHDIDLESGVPSNAAGVHSFDMEQTLIAQNEIFDVHDGVFHKRSTGNIGATIVDNDIHDVEWGIYQSIGGAGDPPHISQIVRRNRIVDCTQGIRATVDETSAQSEGLIIENNHLGCAQGVVLRGMASVRIRNNIIEATAESLLTISGLRASSLEVSDNNLFSSELFVRLNQFGGSQERTFLAVDDWQASSGHDQNSLVGPAAFRGAAGGLSWLELASPLRGAGSDDGDIGPHPFGGDIVPGPEGRRLAPPENVTARFSD